MATRKMLYYVGARYNPQLGTYYLTYGQISKAAAKRKENCAYGSMTLTGYETETEYTAAIEELKKNGNSVKPGN